ncbi:MAG: tetratricopeptide repeat protein [Planctomycetes bacterium]|nr:tetratricopeptide repeat protein [Planctomycetota bacterium]
MVPPEPPPAARPDNAALFAKWEAAQKRHLAGELEAARAAMAEVLAADPGNYDLAKSMARWLAEVRSDFVGAEPFVRRAAELKPEAIDTLHLLGSTLTMCGKANEAEATFRATCERVPGDAKLWFGLGVACGQQRKYLEARAAYDRALALEPENGLTLFSSGENHANLRDYAAAERAFAASAKLKGHDDALWRLGDVLARQGKDEAAEKVLRQALPHGSKLARFQAALQLGMFLVERDRSAEALPLLIQATDERPTSREAWRWLARAQRAQGKRDAAARSMARAQELRAEEDRLEEELLLGLIRAQLEGGGR